MIVEEDGDPAQWDTVELEGVNDPDMRRLRHNEDGSCVYLGLLGCTIYDRRPAMCRVFDCRLSAAMLGWDVAKEMAVRGEPVMVAALARSGR